MSNPQLAEWAKETFGLQKAPDASTILKILKRGDQGLIMQADQIEEAVILWINIAENNQIPITWELIKTKATIFAERIGVKNFSASQGWMEKFGKRHCIKMNRIHGEAGSTDIELLQIDKAAIKEKIEGYSARDIYNFDETALFYAAPPRTTISHQKFSGWKDNKKRLTNNKKQEASDHGFSMYHYNSNAWMTRSIFHVFLCRFDHAMKAQKHKVLLILNNLSGYIVDYTPTNIELLFLPPNTTFHLQPLNGNIIWAFKAYFKCKQYGKAYQYIGMIQNGNQDKIGPIDKIFEIDQLWAMKWIREAWESVLAKTIENCWNATIFCFIDDEDSEGSSKAIYWS
ncbi:Homeodomain-like DNA binding domain-containing transcription factor [Phycomyces blakesleeanus NRRL 1555(-)]|uniref:Homeodomain-like DNA binding domain-containing transcription factor n=1 Tax=Phycomyces blakesleeanus (strain ATCC 8743b / DSM 1359 / FGSC 10004 / NBRC 33097 / NRRL 1555) TaxID=763407 RepID=A0A162ZKC4_PHYB8|nr:Homeodomain-like DNA binding domain-containing transcription factor [Phycomyces blakesleeanus NRRL 1555(-)]OAD67401.1 Homeodomain-like DNA binding domain-containing transcription factor [Phycomyces blakesleeanus NRRL 1555(-)]|eukprot:XP_018285441.1 Homeodomain-like DNA binding domain-containing transcription factor [Phycomyces blakesleeanus NRRL 1555(-)]